jgi:hypothetical protein
MDKMVEFDLGIKGVEFLKERIKSGGHTLARRAMAAIDFDAGRVTTFLPSHVSLGRARNFEVGGGLFPDPPESEWRYTTDTGGKKWVIKPKPDTDRQLVAPIRDFLRTNGDGMVVLENFNARPDDPWLQKVSSRLIVFGSDVYHVLLPIDTVEDRIMSFLREAHSAWIFIGVMTLLPGKTDSLLDKKHFTSDELSIMGEKAQKIFVSAYDGEGYVIWSRT